MSDQIENTSIVRQMYAAFAKRDINEILNMLSLDVVWEEPANSFNPAAGIRHGKAGFLECICFHKIHSHKTSAKCFFIKKRILRAITPLASCSSSSVKQSGLFYFVYSLIILKDLWSLSHKSRTRFLPITQTVLMPNVPPAHCPTM